MSFLNGEKHAGKFWVIAIFIFFLLTAAPRKTNAQFFSLVSDPITEANTGVTAGSAAISATAATAGKVAELSANGLIWLTAKVIVQKLTAETVNYINSGFQGNPAFITNPDQFFLSVGDNVASTYLSDQNGSLNKLCSPFKAQVRLALVKNYLSENQNYSCTLGTLVNNYNAFTSDFSQGGWDAWFNVTQNNQSNPYGAYLDTQNQLAIQIGTAQNNYSKQLDWGQGFLSFEKCTKYAIPNNPIAPQAGASSNDGSASLPSEAPQLWSSTGNPNDCIEKQTVTPGSVINASLEKSLGAGVDALNAADSINEIFGALTDQLINKVITGANGLLGTNPKPATLPQPSVSLQGVNVGLPNNPGTIPPDTGGNGDGGDGSNPDSTIDQSAQVQAAKDSVIADGINPATSVCAEFEITRRAAINAGAGVLLTDFTTNPNYCNGYSSDIVAFPNGDLIDVLNGNLDAQWLGAGTTSACDQAGKECRYSDPKAAPAYKP